jgi:putative DNA primase/helicase
MMALDPRSLARALDGEVHGRNILAPGPGHSRRDRSLSVKLDPSAPDGFVVHSFADDDPLACRDHVKARAGLTAFRSTPSTRRKPAEAQPAPDRDERHDIARAVWREAQSPRGTLVERYLAVRGLALPAEVLTSGAIRFHPACAFRLGTGETARLPAMVALMRDVRSNEPRAIHRTALRGDGTGKAEMPDGSSPKKMLGAAQGAAVKLIADEEITAGLGIAEGIETALAVIGAGWRPVWAAGSAGAIGALPLLAGIETLTVFADAEPAGLKAARSCAQAWQDAGCEAQIIAPPAAGSDWNDVLRGAL